MLLKDFPEFIRGPCTCIGRYIRSDFFLKKCFVGKCFVCFKEMLLSKPKKSALIVFFVWWKVFTIIEIAKFNHGVCC